MIDCNDFLEKNLVNKKCMIALCISELFITLAIIVLIYGNVISIPAAVLWIIMFTLSNILLIFNKTVFIKKILYYVLIILLSYSVECSMQLMIEHEYKIIFSYQRIIDFVLYIFIFTLFGALCNKKTTGLLICRIILYFIENLNFLVTYFRGKPVYFPDIFSVKTAMDVVGGYSFPKSKVWMICLFIMLANLVAVICYRKCEFDYNIKIQKRIFKIAGILLIPFVIVLLQIPTRLQMRGYFFSTTEYWLYSFSMSAYQMKIEQPETYDTENVPIKEISDSYEEDLEDMPNVIFIMNESFADMRVISEFDGSEKIMPYFDRISNDSSTLSGNLYTSIYGGNTANTEFEVLTGVSMYFLPYDTTSYNLYVKDDTYSMATYFNDLGYRTIAFHPSAQANYYRNSVYPYFGFQETYFQEDYENLEFLRNFTSDESNYEKVIDFFEEKDKNEKIFLFNVTVQNHGPFDMESENFDNKVSLLEGKFDATNQYFSCLKYSDEALEQLLNYFNKYDEPVAVVFFGDHQPKIDNGFYEELYGKNINNLSEEDEMKKYIVPYLIWTNYDIDFEQNKKNMSANYLGAYAIQQLGLPQTAFQKYLNNLQEEYPVITAQGVSSNGNNYIKDVIGLETYENISYNLLFEENELWTSLYSLNVNAQ